MKDIETRCQQTTRHIADKILFLRRANNLTQEIFAEKVGLDLRTISRAESGKHRPAVKTMELIAAAFQIPISYFFDDSKYKVDISRVALIYEINTRLNILSKNNLIKVKNFIDII